MNNVIYKLTSSMLSVFIFKGFKIRSGENSLHPEVVQDGCIMNMYKPQELTQ